MMREGEPALPDRSASASRVTFKWPCEWREAHASHDRTWVGNELSRFNQKTQKYGRGARLYLTGDGTFTKNPTCPGVSAHPRTMIGGRYERC